ncbi:MAG: protein O-mannosyl-transferase family, partial [Acidobacteriota bacterium]
MRTSVTPHTGRDSKRAIAAALLAGTVAGGMYWATLLPGLDLGDTASFQTVVMLPIVVPRHAYPLYFALGKLFVFLLGQGNPAFAMNVLSAAAGVAAIIASAWLAYALTGRVFVGLWSALLFAGSYTFWSQALIAEVYTLEALFIALVLIAAVGWWRSPTAGRLAVLYGVYALSFGNHLSMILLAPALIWLLWMGRTRATLNPFSPLGVALAAAIAGTGALQYAWSFSGLWALSTPRPPMSELLSTFWFDVTKSDWRATLVGTVPVAQWGNRIAMYWWDLQQQFGLLGIAIAASGIAVMLRASLSLGMAFVLAYIVTFAFAFIYNVGDTHVFLLPSHQIVAAFAAIGASALVKSASRTRFQWALMLVLIALPASRIADTWPAVDRSSDRRAEGYAEASVAGLTPASSVYVADLNWQTQNAVGYHLAIHRPEVPRVFAAQVLWHFPEFVRHNHELGREIVLTKPAADAIASAYGTMFPLVQDSREPTLPLGDVASIPPGTPYVLVLMTPLPELVYDAPEVARVTRALTGLQVPRARYAMMAGLSGSSPLLNRS